MAWFEYGSGAIRIVVFERGSAVVRAWFVRGSGVGTGNGLRFYWGLGYTKAQNKNSLGFVFGKLHEPYLEDLCRLVRATAERVSACRVCVMGYSMGGFGAYQVASHDPGAFDAAVPVAGYGLGTLEPPDRGYGAPQPASARVFEEWLRAAAPRLARLPLLLVVHAERDAESSVRDARAIVARVRAEGGCARLAAVPDEAADSDPGRKGARRGHRCALPPAHRWQRWRRGRASRGDA
ncbi:unnamed protein product [Prorocentrum cordatum]|uniref:Peptidase S9 prolyl oligopeptidase catalytic domain-containing protein n=1 Tax=Prorocentrum cordatum TaxID=2364126 RepID=A0ABN9X9V6_9DINO|nr:unnamed protein product [Polarella glacialis]